jgi:hypothetical protein
MTPTLAEMAALPAPTEAQYRAFAEHLCFAHSWYKHLSLVRPSRFVVFLARDAGGDYDEAKPRLHHAWKTTAEYRRRFGHLDYQWRHPDDEEWRRDTREAIAPPAEILERCSFELGPLCSNDFNAVEVIISFWSSETGGGGWYPDEQALLPPARRAEIDELARLEAAVNDAYYDLTEEEREQAFREEGRAATPGLSRLTAAREARGAHYERLRRPEVAKIEAALARLAALLAGLRGQADGP